VHYNPEPAAAYPDLSMVMITQVASNTEKLGTSLDVVGKDKDSSVTSIGVLDNPFAESLLGGSQQSTWTSDDIVTVFGVEGEVIQVSSDID
jgi:hypothetical protein